MARNYKQLERIVRGFSNHRRIEILDLLQANPGIDVMAISDKLGINFKTASEHTRRLAIAGLVYKKPKGQSVLHTVSPYGQKALAFVKSIE